MEQARFTYSLLGKAFEKQIKITEDKRQKQIDALKSLKRKEQTKAITHDDESLGQNEKVIINYLTNNVMRYKT